MYPRNERIDSRLISGGRSIIDASHRSNRVAHTGCVYNHFCDGGPPVLYQNYYPITFCFMSCIVSCRCFLFCFFSRSSRLFLFLLVGCLHIISSMFGAWALFRISIRVRGAHTISHTRYRLYFFQFSAMILQAFCFGALSPILRNPHLNSLSDMIG